MGFLKKLRKRDDRYARAAKSKAAKKDAREVYRYQMAQEAAERELVNLEQRCLLETQIIFFHVLHEDFGFGAKRLFDLAYHVNVIGECMKDKKLGVRLKDLRDQLEAETGYRLDVHEVKGGPEIQVQKQAVDAVSILYLLELHDKYGFGKARLEKMYHACAKVGSEISYGKMTIRELAQKLEEAGIAPKFKGERVTRKMDDETREVAS